MDHMPAFPWSNYAQLIHCTTIRNTAALMDKMFKFRFKNILRDICVTTLTMLEVACSSMVLRNSFIDILQFSSLFSFFRVTFQIVSKLSTSTRLKICRNCSFERNISKSLGPKPNCNGIPGRIIDKFGNNK
uniref:Uncharacterized protein n=1 Tax=Glossina austeni TaxID=7395 RepID=A0A1A9VUY9_GLOAU